MKQEVAEATAVLIREKEIDKKLFEEIIKSVFLSMIKRKYNHTDNFFVTFNVDKGDIEIQCNKIVVPDGEVQDPIMEISLTDAQEIDPYVEVGEELVIIVDHEKEFGRRIIMAAKQNLIQRLREIEKDNLFQEFSKRIGEIVIGDVHQITVRGDIRLNIDKTEAYLPKGEQVPSERYRRGDSLKAIVLDVRKTTRDPEIVISRRDVKFVRRLFELEVPEIFDGIVEIKTIAREAGERTKIAVISNDKRIDPVGACVGMKGIRIQAIVKELNREKIDIIPWTSDTDLMIRRAMAPVIPLELIHLEGGNKVLAVIQDEQMALAIGKRGMNVRLASQLSGVVIEPVKASEYYQEELKLEDVEGISPDLIQVLKDAGYGYAEEALNDGVEKIAELTGLDPETTQHIVDVLNSYFEESE